MTLRYPQLQDSDGYNKSFERSLGEEQGEEIDCGAFLDDIGTPWPQPFDEKKHSQVV